MEMKIQFLKERIEEMRRIRKQDTGELISEVAKKHELSELANNPSEVLLSTVLAVRQRWYETVKPRLTDFGQNYV
ncbi:MAG: hypothetical protein V1915_02175 [Candidatus Bathyarchaeota archaeon]